MHNIVRQLNKYKVVNECWIWTGSLDIGGYGITSLNGKTWRAHRLSYTYYKNTIPNGLFIDHTCNNRSCINPAHLEAVTCAENNKRRGKNQEYCVHGHKFTNENTRINKKGHKSCRLCGKLRDRLRRNYSTLFIINIEWNVLNNSREGIDIYDNLYI